MEMGRAGVGTSGRQSAWNSGERTLPAVLLNCPGVGETHKPRRVSSLGGSSSLAWPVQLPSGKSLYLGDWLTPEIEPALKCLAEWGLEKRNTACAGKTSVLRTGQLEHGLRQLELGIPEHAVDLFCDVRQVCHLPWASVSLSAQCLQKWRLYSVQVIWGGITVGLAVGCCPSLRLPHS